MDSVEYAVQAFLSNSEAGYVSGTTLTWYQDMLNRFVAFAGKKSIVELTPSLIGEYVTRIHKEEEKGQIKRSTARSLIRVMKSFCKWTTEEYDLPLNPAKSTQATA